MKTFKINELNLDCMPACEIMEFIEFIGNGLRPVKAGQILFPTRFKGYLRVTRNLRNYAWNKYTAMGLRGHGEVGKAIAYEKICDRIYDDLKEFVNW